MGSGPVCAMVWEGRDAVKTGRAILGATNPLASSPGTIRGDFAIVSFFSIRGFAGGNEGVCGEGIWVGWCVLWANHVLCDNRMLVATSATDLTASTTLRRRFLCGSRRVRCSSGSRALSTGSTRRLRYVVYESCFAELLILRMSIERCLPENM